MYAAVVEPWARQAAESTPRRLAQRSTPRGKLWRRAVLRRSHSRSSRSTFGDPVRARRGCAVHPPDRTPAALGACSAHGRGDANVASTRSRTPQAGGASGVHHAFARSRTTARRLVRGLALLFWRLERRFGCGRLRDGARALVFGAARDHASRSAPDDRVSRACMSSSRTACSSGGPFLVAIAISARAFNPGALLDARSLRSTRCSHAQSCRVDRLREVVVEARRERLRAILRARVA